MRNCYQNNNYFQCLLFQYEGQVVGPAIPSKSITLMLQRDYFAPFPTAFQPGIPRRGNSGQ